MSAFLDGKNLKGNVSCNGQTISLTEIACIWWQALSSPRIIRQTVPEYRQWMEGELVSAISTVATALRVPIFPDPDTVAAAGRKWRQLIAASRIGLQVPPSLLTSSASELRNFASTARTVYKTLSHPSTVNEDGTIQSYVYTNLLNDADLEWADEVEHSVAFLQHFVKKRRDIRVTIVGDRVFAVAIESQRSARTAVDWRRYDVARTPHRIIALDPAFEAKCLQLMESFGLQFATLDFAEDKDGVLWFLELNPNGLWAWLELLTGISIADAIADHLEQMVVNVAECRGSECLDDLSDEHA